MNHRILSSNSQAEIVNLFTSVFTDSEGQAEGKIIGNLTSELFKAIDDKNILCFATYEHNS
ncbi:MAG: GNAT family N-acetyltransferase, partial [Desulfobacterales bacterium]|nr:GNAT family N-acetyltransferase [Desulfobacterales bacterium]